MVILFLCSFGSAVNSCTLFAATFGKDIVFISASIAGALLWNYG
jgi:hypothetical protein